MINVTKTFLPPIEEYQKQVKRAWDNQWLTNRGELVLELEEKLKSFLSVSNIIITNNGTIPLQIALKLLGKQGEIITTPFSYVATTASILWENCKPVFVDIDPEYLTIDETQIEVAITDKTTAILATHVFGNPCHLEKIEKIAEKHNLKVIYDAAHAFGVSYNGKSIFDYGDVSTCSFHATKLFHTGEGGAMFANNPDLQHQLFYSHNFGHNGPLAFHGLGINGKISELQAAMGLAVFPYMGKILSGRKKVVDYYDDALDFSKMKRLKIRENTDWNYSYYPVIFETEAVLLEAQKQLNENQIFPRRYFYPSLNTIEYASGTKMPVSESIASRILCLPLYVGLEEHELKNIVGIINRCL
ncbi:DegT/DnrJ/EryC1/StrS aminotransferase [Flavobacterium cauense R2A-7]|uniref:dTDP-4-amino-4,6-dideoxygalactose transaminase n=1 Tax=Flavobacterium cauense R2A-7 TaxID=1341154 RepID=V6S320_9FLAO|nr:DegT/DnrJ/EryC1/StrS family aminotransferase [Flavobacterium cauense]ESU20804.1 DegT/DnrJ/EryC1/StrS aminotransferase [Flavobacterium cauense R2A-7]KGO82831.1 aminotransferase DegT [Flavobacterium cauense R2A-7]TWI12145.1 dTDP-4-amino-4,6-dideoxygalactose transaminase [Flavobacterium cauense R2A-7]